MVYCRECRNDIRVSYPFGKKSRAAEYGHEKGCRNRVS